MKNIAFRTESGIKVFLINLIWLLSISSIISPINADTLYFTNGKKLEGVKSLRRGSIVSVWFQSGIHKEIPAGNVTRIEKKGVVWNEPGLEKRLDEMIKRMQALDEKINDLSDVMGLDHKKMLSADVIISDGYDLLWRSALVPGWGHMYAEENFTGFTYSLFFYSALILAIQQEQTLATLKEDQASNITNIAAFTMVANSLPDSQNDYTKPAARLVGSFWFWTNDSEGDLPKSIVQAQKDQKMALGFAGILYLGQLFHAWWLGDNLAKDQYSSSESNLPTVSLQLHGFDTNTKNASRIENSGATVKMTFHF